MRVIETFTSTDDLFSSAFTLEHTAAVRETIRVRIFLSGLASSGNINYFAEKTPSGGTAFALHVTQSLARPSQTRFEMIYPGTALTNPGSGVYELAPGDTIRVTVTSANSADTTVSCTGQILDALNVPSVAPGDVGGLRLRSDPDGATIEQILARMYAVLCGRATDSNTASPKFYNPSGTVARVTMNGVTRGGNRGNPAFDDTGM